MKNSLIKQLKHCPNIQVNYVPKHTPVQDSDVKRLKDFISQNRKILVLTGAGISTESGIPDYRSEEVGLYARTNHKPVQYQEFIKHAEVRKRYWARNFVGWDRFSRCIPNASHLAVKDMERQSNRVTAVVTQNVDGLHGKAGSTNVVELHGSSFRVLCLNCNATYDRHAVQEWLVDNNCAMGDFATMIRPDGDVDIPQERIKDFNPPKCRSCCGDLKPDIVFFGDNVPKQRVEKVKEFVSNSDSLLILGSSLSVFSSYRIVLQALEENKNICIVNIGPTRADKLVKNKISAKCGDILSRLF